MQSQEPTDDRTAEREPPPQTAGSSRQFWLYRAVLYPDAYLWYILLAAFDVMLTWVILRSGGSELNAIADWVIRRYDVPGVVLYKFLLVLLVVVICEVVGRRNHQRGQTLARWAVIITAFPVVIALIQITTGLRGHIPE
jgi:hypothetical protein